jgi:MFS family permease
MNPIAFVYLLSYVLSLLGNSIAAIALPLIILQTTGSVLGAGTVAAATAVPAVLAGLLMGVVIDRFNRLTSSIVTDVVSALSIAALPLVALATDLTVGWFVLFGVIGSLGDIPGMTAREALLPAIVRESGMSAERLIGLRESLGAIALVLGPAIAGTLISVLEGTTVLWVTAATSLVAALLTLFLPRRVGVITPEALSSTPRGLGWIQLREGWTTLFRNPFLVAVTVIGTVLGVVLASLQGLVLPVYFSTTDQGTLLGFVLSALAAGLLLGSAIYAIAARTTGRRVWLVLGLVGTAAGLVVIATLASAVTIFVGAFVVGAASGMFSSVIGVATLERIPESLRGRVIGTQNAIATAAPALGIMGAAVLTESFSITVAAIVLASVWVVTAVVSLCVRSLRTAELSAGAIDPVASSARDIAPGSSATRVQSR